MRFIYVLSATRLEMLTVGPTPEEQAVVSEHAEHLLRLAEEGTVVHFGRTANNDERTLGIVIFDAADVGSAERILQSDPVIRAGVMRADLFPYRQAYPK